MKQDLPAARNGAPRIVVALLLLALCALAVSGCVTRSRSSSPPAPDRFESAKVETAPVTNINTAATEELEKLPGVGPGIAERIVAHRQQYGPFRRAEHLMMVRGISDHKFRQMRTMIVAE